MGKSSPRYTVDVTAHDTDLDVLGGHALGTRYVSDGKTYIFVQVDEAAGIADDLNVAIDTGWQADQVAAGDRIDGVNTTGETVLDNEYFWLQVGGLVAAANIATATAAGALLSRNSDANADFVIATDVDEGGVTTHAAGDQAVRAVCLVAESGGLSEIRLYTD